jgi:hypothetical protein
MSQRLITGNVSFTNELSSRPERSEVEGPAVFLIQQTTFHGSVALPFVIPSVAEGSAVLLAGIAVKGDPQSSPNGRFGRLHDPEAMECSQPDALSETGHSCPGRCLSAFTDVGRSEILN